MWYSIWLAGLFFWTTLTRDGISQRMGSWNETMRERQKPLQTKTAVWFSSDSKKEGGIRDFIAFDMECIWSQKHTFAYSHSKKVDGWTWNGCPMKKKTKRSFFYSTTTSRQMRSRERKNWQRNLSLRTVKYFCGFFIVNIRNMLMKTHNDHQILFHKWQFAFTFSGNNKINCFFSIRSFLQSNVKPQIGWNEWRKTFLVLRKTAIWGSRAKELETKTRPKRHNHVWNYDRFNTRHPRDNFISANRRVSSKCHVTHQMYRLAIVPSNCRWYFAKWFDNTDDLRAVKICRKNVSIFTFGVCGCHY